MIDKRVATTAEALAGIGDGSVILIGGFGLVGQPNALIDALIASGVRELTVVANNAGGSGRAAVTELIRHQRVRKMICSFPRSLDPSITAFEDLYRAGKIELELVPQGTLAERLRAAGVGIPAFYTRTAVGTELAKGKETREFNGREYVMERALCGDVALVEAWQADRLGNLTYRMGGRNFNPLMAAAARLTIVQTHIVCDLGELDPETIVTPGIFVDRVVHVPNPDPL